MWHTPTGPRHAPERCKRSDEAYQPDRHSSLKCEERPTPWTLFDLLAD